MKEEGETNAAAEKQQIVPRVLNFDEQQGALMSDVQDEVQIARREVPPEIELHWRAWSELELAKELGMKQADMAAALSVLRTIWTSYPVQDEGITIMFDPNNGRMGVFAQRALNAGECLLAPCVPRCAKLWEQSEHPFRVAIDVIRKTKPYTVQTAVAVVDNKAVVDLEEAREDEEEFNWVEDDQNHSRFYVVPEWKGPEDIRKDVDKLRGDQPFWKWDGSETMQPFWAVRRLNKNKIATAVAVDNKPKPRFNCSLVDKSFTEVTIGTVRDKSMSVTCVVTVPFMTNTVDVSASEELLLEVVEPKKKAGRKENWKDQVQQRAAKKQRAETTPTKVGKP